jgi:hypothetical protein
MAAPPTTASRRAMNLLIEGNCSSLTQVASMHPLIDGDRSRDAIIGGEHEQLRRKLGDDIYRHLTRSGPFPNLIRVEIPEIRFNSIAEFFSNKLIALRTLHEAETAIAKLDYRDKETVYWRWIQISAELCKWIEQESIDLAEALASMPHQNHSVFRRDTRSNWRELYERVDTSCQDARGKIMILHRKIDGNGLS